MIEAFEYLVNLVTKHRVMATGAMLQEAFGDANAQRTFPNGKLAMYQVSTGAAFAVADAVRQQGLPLVYAPLPSFKTAGAGQVMDDNGLPVGAKHPEEAWTFVTWSADTPNWAISRGSAPPRFEHFDAWEKELYADIGARIHIQVFRDSLRHGVKRERLTSLPTFDQMQREILNPAFTRLWAGEASIAATLREIKGPLQAMVPRDLPS